ncbi:hypothetical protein [Burkholderia ubonensis]|uniref:hypothetical protein n=1 Tax=Burkholderia ubonensis TaxID=101571 RepID=UPI0012FBAB6F|nr:hypothetical protein [Burkholderia ubonensis]
MESYPAGNAVYDRRSPMRRRKTAKRTGKIPKSAGRASTLRTAHRIRTAALRRAIATRTRRRAGTASEISCFIRSRDKSRDDMLRFQPLCICKYSVTSILMPHSFALRMSVFQFIAENGFFNHPNAS